MSYSTNLTVQDILQRPHFHQAILVAGKNGIYRVVNWVHIAEVAEVGHLLNGNELILTTGVGWGKEKASRLSFLTQVIERDSAGLCIELGHAFSEVPDDMCVLADKHNFPLIAFPREVRFVDITKDLHIVIHETKQRRFHENQWIGRWLEGKYKEEEIVRHLAQQWTVKPKGVIGCVGNILHSPSLNESNLTRLEILSRTAFTAQHFTVFLTVDKNCIVYILVDRGKEKGWKQRVQKGIESFRKTYPFPDHPIQFGIGKRMKHLNQLNVSFQEAQETLSIQQKMKQRTDAFYDDLHILRIISRFNETNKLEEFIMDYLKPVIEYDRTHRGEMMQTLKTFLACNGSKQETAAQLFIVRQTLYNRLEKLDEMLGADFMSPGKRLAIEFAIAAYEFLYSSAE